MRIIVAMAIALTSTAAMGQTASPTINTGSCGGGTCTVTISAGSSPDYRLITQTYGGRIDIRKGLTQEQCEHDRLKALRQPADDEER